MLTRQTSGRKPPNEEIRPETKTSWLASPAANPMIGVVAFIRASHQVVRDIDLDLRRPSG